MRRLTEAGVATLVYATLTLALTWPLARGMTRDLPSDFGDPLLNCWILSWDADHLLAALGGDPSVLRGYWNAGIFHPHPLALAYSDHLTAQAIEILPVHAIWRNPVLSYNVLFLSTFVLSGLGAFLFAREITGNRHAAFIAGLAYAFAPYRFGSLPHVQVLSSMWMPFALVGFRRFFDTRRLAPLAWGAAAWLAQNLSSGYYLLYFSPLLILYLVWELTVRRLWRSRDTLTRLASAVLLVAAATAPFLVPYAELRRLAFAPRSLVETDRFSADTLAYLTAHPGLRLWGQTLDAFPKPEGTLFPGLTILSLALAAILAQWRVARERHAPVTVGVVSRSVGRVLGYVLLAASAVLVAMLLGWTFRYESRVLSIKITDVDRVLYVIALATGLLLVVSSGARDTLRQWVSSPVGMLTVLTLTAVVMSFGPQVRSHGRVIEGPSLYAAFYRFVPGFDGLRVPARFGMIVALGLAALSAYGVLVVGRLRSGSRWVALAALLIVVESWAAPIDVNGNSTDYKQRDLAPLPAALAVGSEAPGVYQYVQSMDPSTALLELPFGEVAFETRYMFYAIAHHRPLVNGYSGGEPAEHGLLTEVLKDALIRPERAWDAVTRSGATHVIVHEAGYTGERGRQVSEWLIRRGAREIRAFGTDRLFEIPRGS